MQISTVINQMLILLILLVVGVVSRKVHITDDEGNRKISRLLINVCQSAMILAAVLNNDDEFSLAYVGKILGVSALMYILLRYQIGAHV